MLSIRTPLKKHKHATTVICSPRYYVVIHVYTVMIISPAAIYDIIPVRRLVYSMYQIDISNYIDSEIIQKDNYR
jgi:hypothetical protein